MRLHYVEGRNAKPAAGAARLQADAQIAARKGRGRKGRPRRHRDKYEQESSVGG